MFCLICKDGYMSEEQLDCLREHLVSLYASVRPDAAAYVDGFDCADRHLGSALGRYDGNVYESMFEWTRNYPMNKDEVGLYYFYICFSF